MTRATKEPAPRRLLMKSLSNDRPPMSALGAAEDSPKVVLPVGEQGGMKYHLRMEPPGGQT